MSVELLKQYIPHKAQRGDTIVEVLIAIAVASLVLAITYSTMNRNLIIARDSQERTEATKIAQGQIELLKSHSDLGDSTINSGTFCLNDTYADTTELDDFTGGAPSASLPDDFSTYDPDCVAIDGLYNIAIEPNSGLYRVYVRWDNVRGTGQNEVIMVYKL